MSHMPTIMNASSMLADPAALQAVMNYCETLAKSDFIPKDYQDKPGNVLVAIQWGMEVGLQPLQAMQNIAVVNGRPSMWGDAVLALVKGSSVYEYIKESFDDAKMIATCEVKRKGEDAVIRTFSKGDAEKANLWSKSGTWQNYPKRMLQMRARAWALRDAFPDVLKGMAIAEEVADIDAQSSTVSTVVDVKTTPGGLLDKVSAAKSAVATPPAEEPIVDVIPEEPETKTFKDLAEMGLAIQELGLEMTTKEQKGKTYAIISGGNVEGLEETLVQYGFAKGDKAWGMEVTALVAAEAEEAFK